MLTQAQLAEKTKTDLVELARELEVEIPSPAKLKKDDIVALIVTAQTARSGLEMASGILDILPEGYGFLRRGGYVIGNDDIYVSQSQIRRFELRRGDMVEGQVRRPKESEKYYGLI
ncbi:MAG: Rho termination factor N-terminal domain-containing protein, partial [Candidatus Eremiobacteraeota bacterium]|nr:Rho termination factor N-terminal domain-containing protein [Candidatus Eremiobacteraeota bacterium]